MGRVNVYLPDELDRLVKASGMPVSEVCQKALRAELQRLALESTARTRILWEDDNQVRRP